MRRLGRLSGCEDEEGVAGNPVGDGPFALCCCWMKRLTLATCSFAERDEAFSFGRGAEGAGRSWRGGGETPRRPAEAEEGAAVGAAIPQKSKQCLPLVYRKSFSLTNHS